MSAATIKAKRPRRRRTKAENARLSEARRRADEERARRRIEYELTNEEVWQFSRIMAERVDGNGNPRAVSRSEMTEALDCIVADREKGEMVCHGGKIESL